MTTGKPLNPRDIPTDLLTKYDVRGPRYTSYPTAPQFRGEFDPAAVEDLWRNNSSDGNGKMALYVHVPFCSKRCLYCGCTTEIGKNREFQHAYVSGVLQEAATRAALLNQPRTVTQLALGGGTPAYLEPTEFQRLVQGLQNHFPFDTAGERSLEIDPRVMNTEYLDLLLTLKFNRFSFGIQDLEPAVQEMTGRRLSREKIADLVDFLHQRGVSSVNLDLMYGLPGQTPETLARTVTAVLKLQPSRIALFGYAHVPWISPHQKVLEKFGLPDAQARTELFGTAYDLLTAAGYLHIGMDHFALPADELAQALAHRSLTRNFMGYTTGKDLDLLGLGASAISSMSATYTQNIKTASEYLAAAPSFTWNKSLILTREDLLRRDLIMELFCNFYMNIPRLEKRHSIQFHNHFSSEINRLEPFINDGLMHLTTDAITLTSLGRFFVRNICMTFDQYLKTGKYSKTV